MNWAITLRRWTMHTIHAAVLGAALLGSADVVFGQGVSINNVKLPKQHFTKSATFDLPVDMPQEYRAQLSAIRLFVKTPNAGWKLAEEQPATATRFSCKCPVDGEYWYSLATVDKLNRQTPTDVTLEPPNQRVMIDTTPPVIQVQPVTTPTNELSLRCTVLDANPEPTSLRAYCKTEFADIPFDEVPGQPGVFLIKGSEPMRFPVIVSARDQAGNITTKEVNVRDLMPGAKQDIVPISGSKDPLPLPPPRVPDAPLIKPDAPKVIDPPHRVESAPPTPLIEPHKTLPSDPLPKPAAIPEQPAQRPAGPYQLINTTHASVEYRLDQVGVSGVGKIEIYLTPDNGQTWHRLGEHAQKNSPAHINLPGDGVYGVRLVITNGNGFGGKAPVRGDLPHCTIEVDTTSPFVQLRSAEIMASTGQIELRWNATDKNLGNQPVSLFYRTRLDGPWQEIAKGIKNEGMHRWTFPRDLGPQIFFKVEITDQAGNLAQDVSRQPVVIDMSEPRLTIVGVTGSGR